MRVAVSILLVLGLLGVSQAAHTNETIGMAFEVVRHGARAGMIQVPGAFPFGHDMLTPTGMRQRFLLGVRNRYRYVTNTYKDFLSDQYVPEQIHAQSTDILRTLQSGESELSGLYPPSDLGPKLSEGEKQSLQSGKGMPPIKIQSFHELQAPNMPAEEVDPGDFALPYGY